ncbi:MAG: hypothetical protein ACYC99_04670 [Candidatus Geothermincolia bacterium]
MERVQCLRAGTRLANIRERLLARSLAPRLPALVGCGEIAPDDGRRIASSAAALICMGPAEVFLAVMCSILTLDLLALVTGGRRLMSLEKQKQSRVLNFAFRSRIYLLRGASVLAALPAKVAYYNQDDQCLLLGVDRCELKDEAVKHAVSR